MAGEAARQWLRELLGTVEESAPILWVQWPLRRETALALAERTTECPHRLRQAAVVFLSLGISMCMICMCHAEAWGPETVASHLPPSPYPRLLCTTSASSSVPTTCSYSSFPWLPEKLLSMSDFQVQ